MHCNPINTAVVLAGLLLTAALPARAEGELMVMPATTRLFHHYDQKVTVKNMGDAPLYLSVKLQKLMNPGIRPENKVDLGDLERPGMLASPDKLTLGPSQTREIVLTSLAEPEREDVYRLYIIPVRSLKVVDAPKDKITAPMSVSIGYGVLVRHLPPPGKQRSGWTHRCEQGGMTLESTGNVREELTDVLWPGGKTVRALSLYPGTPLHFDATRMTLSAEGKPQTLECP
ncbi:hypothetical protein NGK12_11525 [Raoultella ornithinolytica]|uniref:hypothetical protein n=1 Tax=Raoultella ornithinolytica TaxID=54291 RepID=UPI002DBE176B|nr:hypothetical protein [Raoultella ornithinolytica]MEB7861191.1 hypothetical protein [Raoultella ornithinolytica]MEB7983154.1 hypothetical protein [Raoultella ornithinolytica]